MEKRKTTTRDMTQGNIVKQVLLFALPLMLGNVFQMLYNTVDSVVVGQFVSTQALAAVGSTTMIVNMLVVLLVGLVLRLFPAFMMGAYIIKSTTASECITALGRMHIGRQITIPLSVLFRFIPTMQEESAAIKDAMRMREVQFGTKKFWQNPAALIEYRFIPLMISVVKIGDDLSAAALTRGLDNPVRRTNITKVGFTGWDLLAVLIAGAALLSTYFFSPW